MGNDEIAIFLHRFVDNFLCYIQRNKNSCEYFFFITHQKSGIIIAFLKPWRSYSFKKLKDLADFHGFLCKDTFIKKC